MTHDKFPTEHTCRCFFPRIYTTGKVVLLCLSDSSLVHYQVFVCMYVCTYVCGNYETESSGAWQLFCCLCYAVLYRKFGNSFVVYVMLCYTENLQVFFTHSVVVVVVVE